MHYCTVVAQSTDARQHNEFSKYTREQTIYNTINYCNLSVRCIKIPKKIRKSENFKNTPHQIPLQFPQPSGSLRRPVRRPI